MKGIGAGSRLFEIMERKTAIPTDGVIPSFRHTPLLIYLMPGAYFPTPKSPVVGLILPSAHGKISFDNVSFRYPTRPQTRIFENASFTVEPGTSTYFTIHQTNLGVQDP